MEESFASEADEGSGREVAFGYINMPDDLPEQVRVVEQQLCDGARVCGWSLGSVFAEEMPESSEAFERLQVALRHTSMRHVVIPSFTHFGWHPITQNITLAILENDLATDVVALDEDLPPPCSDGAFPCGGRDVPPADRPHVPAGRVVGGRAALLSRAPRGKVLLLPGESAVDS